MKAYEGVFIFPPESTPDARKAQFKNLDDLFAKFGAQVDSKQDWGKKPMGYAIRKFHEGYFLVVDFKMDPAKATEFRKGLELQEDVIKNMVTLKHIPSAKKLARAAAKPVRPPAPYTPAPAAGVATNQ